MLLFLHADTSLPVGFQARVYEILGHSDVSAGAFQLHIAAPGRPFRWIERFVRLRSTILQLPYGDQAIFVKAETFRQLGGFPDCPIMEDYELVRKLRRIGRVDIARESVTTSARRWLANGVWRTTLMNQVCVVARRIGVSPERLAGWRGQRGEEACSANGYATSPTPRPAPCRSATTTWIPKRDVDQGPNCPSAEAPSERIAASAIQWSK